MPTRYNVALHERVAYCLPAATAERACQAHMVDECIYHCVGLLLVMRPFAKLLWTRFLYFQQSK